MQNLMNYSDSSDESSDNSDSSNESYKNGNQQDTIHIIHKTLVSSLDSKKFKPAVKMPSVDDLDETLDYYGRTIDKTKMDEEDKIHYFSVEEEKKKEEEEQRKKDAEHIPSFFEDGHYLVQADVLVNNEPVKYKEEKGHEVTQSIYILVSYH
ncbi:hypothetical protein WA158_002141 [Blastocystis sp. Blastoise]